MDNIYAYLRIPTIELLRRHFCAHPVGTLVETSVRRLARSIGRSEGQITVHLDRLEEGGWIRRLAGCRCTVVEVLRSDHGHDRSSRASGSDHGHDRSPEVDHSVVAPNPPSSPAATVPETDHADDPPLDPPTWNKHVLNMQQPAHTCTQGGDPEDQPPFIPDAPWQPSQRTWHTIRLANPGYTHADFFADLAKAQTRPDIETPLGLTVKARLRGEPVYSQEDLHARAADRPRPARTVRPGRHNAPHRAQRPAAARSAPRQQPPPLSREYLQSRPRRGESGRLGERLRAELRAVPGGRAAADG